MPELGRMLICFKSKSYIQLIKTKLFYPTDNFALFVSGVILLLTSFVDSNPVTWKNLPRYQGLCWTFVTCLFEADHCLIRVKICSNRWLTQSKSPWDSASVDQTELYFKLIILPCRYLFLTIPFSYQIFQCFNYLDFTATHFLPI